MKSLQSDPKVYKRMTKVAALGFLIIFLETTLLAQALTEPIELVRAKGMGGASTALNNEQEALWANPASIARERKARNRNEDHFLSLPQASLSANAEGRRFGGHLLGAHLNRKNSAFQRILNSYGQLNDKHPPLFTQLSFAPVSFFDAPLGSPWGVGFFTSSRMLVVADDGSPRTAQIASVTDMGLNFGFAVSDRNNRLNFGMSFRPTARYDFMDKLELASMEQGSVMQEHFQEGSNLTQGFGVDAGLLWTLADFWFPTLGLTVRNLPFACRQDYLNPYTEERQTICGTAFRGSVKNTESLALLDPSDIRLGFAMTPRLGPKFAFRFALDVQNLYLGQGERYIGLPGRQPLQMLHAGLEFFYGNPLMRNIAAFRFGVNQGFMTLGASLRIKQILLEFASYGEDISLGNKPREDRRHAFLLSAEI